MRSVGLVASLLIGLVMSLAVVVATAMPARAHDVLVAASPEDGAAVPAPEAVTLTFSNAVQNQYAQVAVLDEDETPYQEGDPEVVGPDVTQAVRPLPTGEFTVAYRIISSDGHDVNGTYTFTVTEAAQGVSASPEERTSATPSAPTTSVSSDSGDGRPGVVTIVAMLVGAGAIGAALAVGIAARRRRAHEGQ